jgi:small subunit ribosomal protein S1
VGQEASIEHEWWTAMDEEYWRVLLEQGEVAPQTAPPKDFDDGFWQLGVEANSDPWDLETVLKGGSASTAKDGWEQAQLALEQGQVFDLRVSGANRGGLLVDWNGLQGFIPASHLKEMPRDLAHQDRMAELASRIGEPARVRLIEVDPDQAQLVFSERIRVNQKGSPTEILSKLQPGDVCQGIVTNLTTFGAFVDLGGVEGLVHISELSWERVRHPGDVLRSGEEVRVYVLGVNPEEGRIALSLRRLRPDPWDGVESRYAIGELVEGVVTNVVSFGAFVRLEEGLEGLVHVSELAEGNFMHPRNVVREGDVIKVRVLTIDPRNHRMGLSVRQAHAIGDDAARDGGALEWRRSGDPGPKGLLHG